MRYGTRSLSLILAVCAGNASEPLTPWHDATAETGLAGHAISRLKFTDLNNDGRPDVVLVPDAPNPARARVYLNTDEKGVVVFKELQATGLPLTTRGDVLVFADLDNDGHEDAIVVRYLDIYQDSYEPPSEAPRRTAWLPGSGDGTFGPAHPIPAAKLATSRSIAVGDVNEDGQPDLWIGNWYERYFSGYDAFANDLLLQYVDADGQRAFVRWPIPNETVVTDYHDDLGGRPTYGALLPRLDDGLPMLLELNYGRRWNRLYQMRHRVPLRPPHFKEEPATLVLQDPRAQAQDLIRHLQGRDIAPAAHVDGDAIRHGRHPVWPDLNADAQPRSRRHDEPPFRANGNTFDAAVGDIDNDGDFDLFVSTIIHAWAGESSDRSRFLVNQLKETGQLDFVSFARLSVDRIPDQPIPGDPLQLHQTNYNQGDIYAELADLNLDGQLDLVLCSSDYPDPPPHDERLRIFFQQSDGRFRDVTTELGIDHVGAGMPSLADVDGDGDLDLIVGQSFNRLPPAQRRTAAIVSGALAPDAPEDTVPEIRARLFLNHAPEGHHALTLRLIGDPEAGTCHDAYGAIVRVTADLDGDPSSPEVTQIRQVLGPGGHAGKQSALNVHFGLGAATTASSIEIVWPNKTKTTTQLNDIAAGRYRIHQAAPAPEPLDR